MKLYAVLKLCTTVGIDDLEFELKALAGYIPVFDTLEKASEVSENGRYQILEVNT